MPSPAREPWACGKDVGHGFWGRGEEAERWGHIAAEPSWRCLLGAAAVEGTDGGKQRLRNGPLERWGRVGGVFVKLSHIFP